MAVRRGEIGDRDEDEGEGSEGEGSEGEEEEENVEGVDEGIQNESEGSVYEDEGGHDSDLGSDRSEGVSPASATARRFTVTRGAVTSKGEVVAQETRPARRVSGGQENGEGGAPEKTVEEAPPVSRKLRSGPARRRLGSPSTQSERREQAQQPGEAQRDLIPLERRNQTDNTARSTPHDQAQEESEEPPSKRPRFGPDFVPGIFSTQSLHNHTPKSLFPQSTASSSTTSLAKSATTQGSIGAISPKTAPSPPLLETKPDYRATPTLHNGIPPPFLPPLYQQSYQ
ncbi:hypothetical protein B0T14DRAFT_310350 [Immersiella caudata]|uniref:Uncharacterized protein n=1 Tax=Immersiella caudata TaxID=314043 RepID=A0AA39WFQ1_9PEZI|nr:hypothetical protein B0T14DRAFT_310350 [Immersiella caudata]